MNDVMKNAARELCGLVNWDRGVGAALRGRPGQPHRAAPTNVELAEACRKGDVETAAMGFVRHLRERSRPRMGYTPQYVAKLRKSATPAFCDKAKETIRKLLYVPFLGGDWPDGRGTLLWTQPEVLQVAATREDFLHYARMVAESRATWEKGAIHTIMPLLRYIQSVWPLEECPDEALVPLLAFLAVKLPSEWKGARNWGDSTHGTSGHNWYIAQFGATWKGALLFPELKGFEQFQAFFPDYFEREIRILSFPDGFTQEASVSYHIGTLDLFLDAVRLAHLNGLRFSKAFYDRLRAWGETEWKFVQPDGNYPAFGDCFNLGPHLFERMRSVAAILKIPEAKYLAEKMDPGRPSPFGKMLVESLNYPSVGEDLAPAYRRLKARAPKTLDTVLPDSGYYMMRQNWTTKSDYLAVEASARGNVVTSHGHGAIFDLKLCSRGRPILVGNGKGPDVGMDEPRRVWRVKSESHCVATVDGEDHVPLRSIYRFANVVLPTVDDWISEKEFAYFSGVHEAYERLPKKVPGSRRKVFYLRGGYWILIDRFTVDYTDKQAEHTYRQHFQVQPEMKAEADGRVRTLGEGGNLLFVPVEGARGEVSTGPCPWPLEGYFNPNQLCYTQTAKGGGLFVTLLVPFLDDKAPDVAAKLLGVETDGRVVSPWEATGLETVMNGRRDVYVDLHMVWNLPWKCGGFSGEGRSFHSRCS